MRIQRVLSLHYGLVITVCVLIVPTLGNPRPDYFDRKTNPDLSQWAEQHQDQVYEMADRLRTEYHRAVTQHSEQNLSGETSGCKTTCIPSTTWVSHTGKTQDEINQIVKEMTLKLVNDLNSGKIVYNQIIQPNWFENYAANELHLLQNQHYQNNFNAQIHIPQGSYYHKSEKKQVYEYTQGGGNIQPTYIYKPTVTTYEEKKEETQEHSSSGYPTVYYGHGETVEKIEKLQEGRKDIETIAHVPVYTDSYFQATDRKGRKKVNRRPTAAPAIHVSYNNQEENAFAQNVHNVYPTTVPVTVTHKEQHIANVEKQTMPIIYKYGNNERRTEQTQHRNRTTSTTYRRPSTSTTSRRNITTTHVETQTRRPTVYSESKHSIYKHLKTDDGDVPNYKPRVVHKESKVGDYYGFGVESIPETIDSHQIQNYTVSSKHQQKIDQSQINYRPAYVGHQSRYNRTHGYNYTRPGYVMPGGTSQTSQTSQTTQTSHQGHPAYAIIGGGQTSQSSQSKQTSQSQQTRPGGYVVVGSAGNSQIESSGKITETVQHTRPGYVVIGGGQQTSGSSQSSQSAQQTSRPGYIFTGGSGGSNVIQTSYTNHTTQETRPGYIIRPGYNSNQISQTSQTSQQHTRPGYVISGGSGSHIAESSHTSQTSQQGTRPGYVITGGGGSQTVETSHSSQTSQQGGRPGFVVVAGGGGSQIVEASHTSQTSQGTRPGYVITGGGGSQTVETSHSSQTSQQGGRPGYVVVTGGGGSKIVETSHTGQTSQQNTRPGYVITGGGGSKTVETSHSSQISQGGRPGYVVVAGGGGSQTVETSHTSQTSQQGTRPGYVITGGGGSQTVETSHSSQTSQQNGRPGYVVVTGGGGSQTVETSHTSQTSQQGTRPGYVITGGGGSQTVETSHSSQTSQEGVRPGYVVVTGGGGTQTVETSHTSQTSQQGTRPGYVITGGGGSQTVETSQSSQTSQQGGRPGYVVVTGGGGSQTVETSHTSQTSQQGTRPGYVITEGGGSQTIETTHSSQTSQLNGQPGYVLIGGSGGSQTVESSHINEISQEKQSEFIVTGVGNSQVIETTHTSETLEQGGHPGYVVVTGGSGSQTVETSHTSQTSQQNIRPGYIISGGSDQTVESSHFNQTTQSGRPGYVVVAGGGAETVESTHTNQITQQGTRPGYAIAGGGTQTIESSHINHTSEFNKPGGYMITSGGNSQTTQSTYSNQTTQHTRPGYVITGTGSQSLELTHSNQSSQQTTNPGYVIAGGGSQTIESTQTNQASQQSRPGYVVIGTGGQTSQISQIDQTSQQTSRPGFIVTGGGSQTVESTYSNQTSEQTSRPGYIIAGGSGSQTTQTSQSSSSGKETSPGYVVIGGEGQSSQISQTNQTSEHLSRPGYIITGAGGSQTIETSQINQNSQENRPGYVVVGGGVSQTSQTAQSNHSSVQGTPGYIVVDGGSYLNYSQEFISQLNQTGGSVHIANGSYVSGLGFKEIETNWTSKITNKKPNVIISKDRGDQPPNQFEDYYDSEEYVEKEPGIGFYPIGLKPEIGLLVTGRPPTINEQSQLSIHGSHGSHNSQSQSTHHTQRNHQAHVYPGSGVTTTHGHHTHTIGTLPGDSRPFLEDHHVDKQLLEEGSSHNIHNSQNYIRDNELRESYGFNKSKHQEESDAHRHSGIRHGQHQHSTQYQHSGSHQHAHRHHHGDRQTGKSEFYIITRNGHRQNVSRNEHEEMLKSQISLLIENFARTVERDIESIHPDEDKETMQVEIVSDNMEQLLLQIKSLIGDDPDTKQMIEQLFNKDLETYQKKYRVKRSFRDLRLGGQKSRTTANSQSTSGNYGIHKEADLENGLSNTRLLSGRVGRLPSFSFSGNINRGNYPVGSNTYNPYDVTQAHNTLGTQKLHDLTQQTQTEDFSQFSLGLTSEPARSPGSNPDSEQKYLEKDFSMFQLINKPGNSNVYNDTKDNQQTLNEDLTQFLDSNQQSQNLNTHKHTTFAVPHIYRTNNVNQGSYYPTYQRNIPSDSTSPFIQYGNNIPPEKIKPIGTCCWQPGSPNYQSIDSKINLTGITVGPVSQKTDHIILTSPIYEAIDKPSTTVGQLGYVSPQPCKTKPANPINPVYSPIDVLPQPIGLDKPKGATSFLTNLPTYHPGIQPDHTAGPFLVDIPQPTLSTGQPVLTQSKPVIGAIYKPSILNSDEQFTVPTQTDKQFTVDVLQSSYPIYTAEQLPSNVQQTGSTGHPDKSLYQSHYSPKQLTIKPIDQAGEIQSIPSMSQLIHEDEQFAVEDLQTNYPIYTDEQLPDSVQQSGSPGYPDTLLYQSHIYTPKHPTIKPVAEIGAIPSKPVVEPIYKPSTSQPTHPSSPIYTEQLPNKVQQSGSPGHSDESIYQSNYTSKQQTLNSTGQPGVISSKPIIDPIYKPGTLYPTQPDEQFTVDVLQSSYPIYSEEQFPSNVQQTGSTGYPDKSLYQSHYSPKHPTIKPIDQAGENQSKPVMEPIYKPGMSQLIHEDEQFAVEDLQTNYPIYTDQQLPGSVQQSGSPGYPDTILYQSHYTPKHPIIKPMAIPSKPVVGPIYKPSTSQQTNPSSPIYTEHLPNKVQQSGSPGHPDESIFQSNYTSKQQTLNSTGQPGVISSKPVVDPIYKPGTLYPTQPDEQFTVDVLQSSYPIYSEEQFPSNVQQTGSTGYSDKSLYQSHYSPKHPTSKPIDQAGENQSKPVVEPIYKPGMSQLIHEDKQFAVEDLQTNYPIYTDEQLPSNVQQSSSPGYPDTLLYQSNIYTPKHPTIKPVAEIGAIPSKPVVKPIYKPSTSQPAHPSSPIYTEQLPNKVQQSGSPGYPDESIYQSNYTSNQQTLNSTGQPGVIPSKPVVDPISKPGTLYPTQPDQQFTVDVLQTSYPIYSEEQFPSNVQQTGSTGYPDKSLYQSHYSPKHPTSKPIDQAGENQSKPVMEPIYKPGMSQLIHEDEQFAVEDLQTNYPIYTDEQLPSNVQQSGSPGYPDTLLYQSNIYTPKHPTIKPVAEIGAIPSKPVVKPIYKPSTSQPTHPSSPIYTEYLPNKVQQSGSPGYPDESIYQSNYTSNQQTLNSTGQPGVISSKPVVDPIYKPGTLYPTQPDEQFTVDVLQSSYPIYSEEQFPSNVQQTGSTGYPDKSLYQSHYSPKHPTSKPIDQAGENQSKPVVEPIYKPGMSQLIHEDEQFAVEDLQTNYPIYTDEQLPSNVQQSGSPGYPDTLLYQSNIYTPKHPTIKPVAEIGAIPSKPVVKPIYKPSTSQPTHPSSPIYTEQLPNKVQQSGSPGHPDESIYQSNYTSKQQTLNSTGPGVIPSKPVVDPIYKPGTLYPTQPDEQFTVDVLQSSYPIYSEEQFPSNVQQTGSTGYPDKSLYQSHYSPKHPTIKPIDQAGENQSKPVMEPNYKPGMSQLIHEDEQFAVDDLQTNYPIYTDEQLPSNVQQSGRPGYPDTLLYQSHIYTPKHPTIKPVAEIGAIPSKPVVKPIYKPSTSQPTHPSFPIHTEQLPNKVQQSGSPGHPDELIYQSNYTSKQQTLNSTGQPGVISSKPIIDPIYKPGTLYPTQPDEQFTVDVLQTSYPIYSEEQFPSNVQQTGSTGYPDKSLYQSHYSPKHPTIKPIDQAGENQSKPVMEPIYKPGMSQLIHEDEQFAVDDLQTNYPIYTDEQLPGNVQQSGSPGYPDTLLYQSHIYTPKHPTIKPAAEIGAIPSKPVVEPIYKPSTSQPTHPSSPIYTEQLPNKVQQSGSPGHSDESIYQSNYTSKQQTLNSTGQPGVISSKPIIDPIYKPGTLYPTQPNEQFTVDVLQSSYPIYSEEQFPSNVQQTGSTGYPDKSLYQSHYSPKHPTIKPIDQAGENQSKPVMEPIYKPGMSQLIHKDEQFAINNLQTNYPIYTDEQLPGNVQQSGSPGYPDTLLYQSHIYTPKHPTIKPVAEIGAIPSKPVVEPIYKPSTLQPTHPSSPIYTEHLPNKVQQSGSPGHPDESIYQSNYTSKQQTLNSTGQPGVISSKPVIDPIYKPGTLYPTQPDEQFTVDVLQSSYPIYSGEQLPSNVQQIGSTGYSDELYQSHYSPKHPTIKPMNQAGEIQSKPVEEPIYKPGKTQLIYEDEQFTVEDLQTNYPIYTDEKLPSNVQQSGSLGYPGASLYQSHYTPKHPTLYYTSHPGMISSKPVVNPTYKPGTLAPTYSDEQFTTDVLQSSYPIYKQLSSDDQQSVNPGYPDAPIYQSHYTPKHPKFYYTSQPERILSKPVDPTYKSGTLQPTLPDENLQIPSYAGGSLLDLHYTSKETTIGLDKMIPSRPIVAPSENKIILNNQPSTTVHQPDGETSQQIINPTNTIPSISPQQQTTTNKTPVSKPITETQLVTNKPDNFGALFRGQPLSKGLASSETKEPIYNYESYGNQYGRIKYRTSDISYLPVRHVFYPRPVIQSEYNLYSGNQLSEAVTHHNSEKLQKQDQIQINQYNDQRSQPVSTIGITNALQQKQYGVLNARPGNINYVPVRHVFYPHQNINAQTTSNMQSGQINGKRGCKNQLTEKLSLQNMQYQHNTQRTRNKSIIPPLENSQTQTQDQIQVNQYTNQNTQTNNLEQITQQNTQQFSGKNITSEQINTVSSEKQEKTNTQQIPKQHTKPLESHNVRRGDQTSFDNEDYGDNSALSEETQDTLLTQKHEYFQYNDPDAELQQLTQKLTKEDFTNFVKSSQRSKRQIVPISVLDYITQKSSNNNENSLVSDENDESVEALIDYQNQPRNIIHI